jgi:hypothetical protein
VILDKITKIDDGNFNFNKIKENITILQNKYSPIKELAGLRGLVDQLIKV